MCLDSLTVSENFFYAEPILYRDIFMTNGINGFDFGSVQKAFSNVRIVLEK